MLQALMQHFAQGPPTLDLDVYGSMILDVHCFYLCSNKSRGNTRAYGVNRQIFLS